MHIRLARALLVGFWVSAAALACDYPVPEDARLRCASDAACPEGFRCEGAIGRCLLRGAAYQPLRAELRGIEPRLVGRGGSTEVRVQVQGAWEEKPRLRVESSAAGREVEAASCDAEQICTFRFSPTLEEGEGSFRVSLRAVDIYAQTLSTDTLGTFEVDQTPPRSSMPSFPSRAPRPGPWCPSSPRRAAPSRSASG